MVVALVVSRLGVACISAGFEVMSRHHARGATTSQWVVAMNNHKAPSTSLVYMVAWAVGWSGVGCIPAMQPDLPPCESSVLAHYVDISDELKTPELQKSVASLTLLNGIWIAVLHCSPSVDPVEREIRIDLQGLSSANVRVVTETQRDPAGAPRLECAPAGSFVVDSTATLAGVDDIGRGLAKCTAKSTMLGDFYLSCDFGSARGGDIQNIILTSRAAFDVDAGNPSMWDGVLLYWGAARHLSSGAYQRDLWTCSVQNFRKA